MHDVIIIGGGPAGLTAAIYASRARLKTLLVESFTVAGQAVITSDIENYPGFPDVLGGFDLIDKFKKQATKFGAEFKVADVKSISSCKHEDKPALEVEAGSEKILSLSVIVASGARPKSLGIPGEDKFRGKGVSYCAVCDAAFFKGKEIIVVGGGDTAVEEAMFLTKFAKKVKLIHRRDRLRATKILQERAFANKSIEFVWNSVATEILGKDRVETVRIKNLKTEKTTDLPTDGVFIFAGYIPNTDFLKGVINLDEAGYILADNDMKTSKPGVFVAGDARKKILRQVITAAGDGATAAYSARLYVEELKGIAYK
ncbi:thioredoxin-disulfide reductase [Candidatus Omnitrophota bacterium]